MLVEVAKVNEIAPGGLKAVDVHGREIVLCNDGGTIYAIDRRCGHMNTPLELGTLEGYILTCPMHHAQFDITTGEALSGPVPPHLGEEVMPDGIARYLQHIGLLMSHIKTCNLNSYSVKVEGDSVRVEIESAEDEL